MFVANITKLTKTMARTRQRTTITSHVPKCVQNIQLDAANLNRKFNRPTSVDVRGSGSVQKVHVYGNSFLGETTAGKLGLSSSITDTVGNRAGFNYVSHTKEAWSCPLHEVTYRTACNPPLAAGTSVETVFTAGAAYAANLNSNLIPWLGSDEELRLEALSQMHPRKVPPKFDVGLEIGELIEGYKSLWDLSRNIGDLYDEMLRLNRWNSPSVRRAMGQKSWQQLTLQDWVQLAIASDLSYKFAVAPFVNLAERLDKAIKGFHDALERVISSETTLHGSSSRSSTTTSFQSNDYHKWGNTRTSTKVVYTTARIRYHSARTTGLKEGFESAYFGKRFNLSTAWELYPLSFVLDWFWNIGSFLAKSLRKPIDDISYSIIYTGWSRKVTTKCEGWVDLLEGTYGKSIKDVMDPGTVITGTLTKTSYLRETIPMDIEAGVVPAPEINIPTLGQLATLAELVYMWFYGKHRVIGVADRVPLGMKP